MLPNDDYRPDRTSRFGTSRFRERELYQYASDERRDDPYGSPGTRESDDPRREEYHRGDTRPWTRQLEDRSSEYERKWSPFTSSHRGKGPRGYQRADSRIHDEICERLAWDHDVDATDIEVEVKDGEVTLAGTVSDRDSRRHAEDIAERVLGVQHVSCSLRIRRDDPDEINVSNSSTGRGASGRLPTPTLGTSTSGINAQIGGPSIGSP